MEEYSASSLAQRHIKIENLGEEWCTSGTISRSLNIFDVKIAVALAVEYVSSQKDLIDNIKRIVVIGEGATFTVFVYTTNEPCHPFYGILIYQIFDNCPVEAKLWAKSNLTCPRFSRSPQAPRQGFHFASLCGWLSR